MINRIQKKVLILALRAGELMMKSGAEIYRVEDTITRICKACKIPYIEVFATPTGIFLSLDEGTEAGEMHTFIKRIKGSGIDLEKISRINHFSREFTNTGLSVDEGLAILKMIAGIRPYPLLLRVLGAAFVASFTALIFGGGPQDFICASIAGSCSYLLSVLLDKFDTNLFIRIFSCCAAATFISLALFAAGLGSNFNSVIIGSIMIFLPGVALTNAVRDTLAGDMVAGASKGIEAVVIAVSITSGVGVALKLWTFMGGAY